MYSAPIRVKGFTLIEIMVVVVIIAILTAIALPSYRDYVIRGNLVDGTQQLAALRAQMEQFYQDSRSYATNGSYTSPCDNPPTAFANWTFSCNNTQTASAYTWTATGVAGKPTAGFTYTIDNNNNQTTTGLPTGWGSTSPAPTCWIMKRGGTC